MDDVRRLPIQKMLAAKARSAALAVALGAVAATVAAITNPCPKCGRRVDVAHMRWDASHWANVCDNDPECILPAEGGRKRARRDYAQLGSRGRS